MPSDSDLDLKLTVKLSPEESWLLYVRCVAGMATDELMGRGPTRKAFIENLRVIADQMESVNAEIMKLNQRTRRTKWKSENT